jgi:hypothetical protein
VLIVPDGQPGANNNPPDAADAIRHGDNPTTPDHLDPAATADPSTEDTASRSADPADAGMTGSTPTATINVVKNKRIASALARNTRSHPRTVSPGLPSRAATVRHPAPEAAAASADPITSTPSARRANNDAGNSTCVTPHDPHRPRRGRTVNDDDVPRTDRDRAQPQRASADPHRGQPIRPSTNAASTATTESPTVTTIASERSAALPASPPSTREGRHRQPFMVTVTPPINDDKT